MVRHPLEPFWGLRVPHVLFGFLTFALLVFGLIVRPNLVPSTSSGARRDLFREASSALNTVPATSFIRLSLGFDWTVRARAQAVLKELSTRAMRTPLDRAVVVRALAKELAPRQNAVAYAFLEEQSLDAFSAESRLGEVQVELEKRFETRTVGEGAKHIDVNRRVTTKATVWWSYPLS